MKRKATQLLLALGLSSIAILVTLAWLNAPARAADQCVAPGGADGCFATIQVAINVVSSGETVRVVAGTYNENLVINKSLTLLGGFADTSLTSRTPRSSIIDGGGVGVVISITNNAIVTIDGFTIRNGDGTTNNGEGGGISVHEAAANIRDNLVENNVASNNPAIDGFGGGIFVISPTDPVLIENNTIRGNLGSGGIGGRGFGGGISSRNASVITITNNIIVENTGLISGSGGVGGGIALGWISGSNQRLTLTDNWIMSNTAGITVTGSNVFAVGGGVDVFGNGADNETLIVQDNHLIGNVGVHQMSASTNGFADGGGLSINDIATANIINNEILDNVTAYTINISGGATGNGGGGGIGFFRSNALLQGNVISNNIAHQAGDGGSSGTLGESYGAGVSVQESTATLERNQILGNRRNAAYANGGNSGLWAWLSTVTSTNNIFAHNFDGLGAGNQTKITVINDTYYDNGRIGISSFMTSTVLVTNTIVYSHSDGLRENDTSSVLMGDYNLHMNNNNYAGGVTPGLNDVILFTPVPLFRDTANDDFHLISDAPAIDKGSSDGAPNIDFEGDARPQGDGIDIGADEFTLEAVFLPFVVK